MGRGGRPGRWGRLAAASLCAVPLPPTSRTPARAAACLAVLVVLAVLTACTTAGPGDAPTRPASAAPTPSASESLLTDEIGDHTAVGRLADGFPGDLVPVPPGAEVLVSSAAPATDGTTVEISLNVRTAQDTAGLLEAVRGPLLAAGFTESAPAAPEAGLAAQVTFARSEGAELLVVGVLDRDGTRTLTLGGTVRTAAP